METIGICTCPGCAKVYTGNPETDQLCLECWIKRNPPEKVKEIEGDQFLGTAAGGWNFNAIPNTIRAMSRQDVLDYLRECPKSRKIWRSVGHNSATPNGCGISIPQSFQNYHIYHNGWRDIGYHWVIDTCGTIYLGRNLVYQGSHAHSDGNPGSVGWCMVGNFSGTGGLPSEAQRESARFLCTAHRQTFGYGCDAEFGHKDVIYNPAHGTSCPGTNIPLALLRSWVCGPPIPVPEEDDEMTISVSGGPVKQFAAAFHIGKVPGGTKDENVYIKVLNLNEKAADVRVLAVTDNAIKDATAKLAQNKSVTFDGSAFGLKGSVWFHVSANREVFVTFDGR